MAKGNEFKRLVSKSKGRFEVKESTIPSRHNDSSRPVFSFLFMRYGDTNCLTRCENAVKASVVDTLVRLSQLTWGKIASQPKEGLGYEKIPHHRFRAALPAVITEEVPILVFRHSDSGRIAGYRDNDIYHVVSIGDNLYTH